MENEKFSWKVFILRFLLKVLLVGNPVLWASTFVQAVSINTHVLIVSGMVLALTPAIMNFRGIGRWWYWDFMFGLPVGILFAFNPLLAVGVWAVWITVGAYFLAIPAKKEAPQPEPAESHLGDE